MKIKYSYQELELIRYKVDKLSWLKKQFICRVLERKTHKEAKAIGKAMNIYHEIYGVRDADYKVMMDLYNQVIANIYVNYLPA